MAAETGAIMLIYLDQAYHERKELGRRRHRSDAPPMYQIPEATEALVGSAD